MQKLLYVVRYNFNHYHNRYVVVKIAKVRVSCHTGMLMAKIDIGYTVSMGVGSGEWGLPR